LKESELDYYIIYFTSATIFKPIDKRTTGRNAILPGAVASTKIEAGLRRQGISKIRNRNNPGSVFNVLGVCFPTSAESS
jgi:hypothetical protein